MNWLISQPTNLSDSINDLISLYKNSQPQLIQLQEEYISIEDIFEPMTIQITSLHQIPLDPNELSTRHDNIDTLWMAISIIRGDGASCCRKVATGKAPIIRSMFPRVVWNQKITLDIEIKDWFIRHWLHRHKYYTLNQFKELTIGCFFTLWVILHSFKRAKHRKGNFVDVEKDSNFWFSKKNDQWTTTYSTRVSGWSIWTYFIYWTFWLQVRISWNSG